MKERRRHGRKKEKKKKRELCLKEVYFNSWMAISCFFKQSRAINRVKTYSLFTQN